MFELICVSIAGLLALRVGLGIYFKVEIEKIEEDIRLLKEEEFKSKF